MIIVILIIIASVLFILNYAIRNYWLHILSHSSLILLLICVFAVGVFYPLSLKQNNQLAAFYAKINNYYQVDVYNDASVIINAEILKTTEELDKLITLKEAVDDYNRALRLRKAFYNRWFYNLLAQPPALPFLKIE
jgi:hypothetical protein